MLYTALTSIALVSVVGLVDPTASFEPQETALTSQVMSLENRYAVPSVNEVFKDNILLTAAYMRGEGNSNPDWETVRKPFKYDFVLQPNQTFAYQDHIAPEYKDKVVKTTTAHFNGQEGFKSDGYLMGDGVCHFASLIHLAAMEAGLDSVAPVNHDFAVIPDIDKKYGVSIYSDPSNPNIGEKQNLYVTNNKGKPVTFRFEYQDNKLKLTVLEQES